MSFWTLHLKSLNSDILFLQEEVPSFISLCLAGFRVKEIVADGEA